MIDQVDFFIQSLASYTIFLINVFRKNGLVWLPR